MCELVTLGEVVPIPFGMPLGMLLESVWVPMTARVIRATVRLEPKMVKTQPSEKKNRGSRRFASFDHPV